MFLPGVPEAYVRQRLALAGGDEIGSGKFQSPESSAALAANAFAWFVERPAMLPPLPGAEDVGESEQIEIEYCARFPWSGGRHPWLDAVLFTATHIVGIESKRFEPFRDTKSASFAAAYDRPVWGNNMVRFNAARDALRNGSLRYRHLDAAQLVKHAYGLVTEGRRIGRKPKLYYIYAEPSERSGQPISEEARALHRQEIADFAERIAGEEVSFGASSYSNWLSSATGLAAEHVLVLQRTFQL